MGFNPCDHVPLPCCSKTTGCVVCTLIGGRWSQRVIELMVSEKDISNIPIFFLYNICFCPSLAVVNVFASASWPIKIVRSCYPQVGDPHAGA